MMAIPVVTATKARALIHTFDLLSPSSASQNPPLPFLGTLLSWSTRSTGLQKWGDVLWGEKMTTTHHLSTLVLSSSTVI